MKEMENTDFKALCTFGLFTFHIFTLHPVHETGLILKLARALLSPIPDFSFDLGVEIYARKSWCVSFSPLRDCPSCVTAPRWSCCAAGERKIGRECVCIRANCSLGPWMPLSVSWPDS